MLITMHVHLTTYNLNLTSARKLGIIYIESEETQMRYTIDIWYFSQYNGNWKNCGYSFPSRIDAKLWIMIEHPNIKEDDYRIREV